MVSSVSSSYITVLEELSLKSMERARVCTREVKFAWQEIGRGMAYLLLLLNTFLFWKSLHLSFSYFSLLQLDSNFNILNIIEIIAAKHKSFVASSILEIYPCFIFSLTAPKGYS